MKYNGIYTDKIKVKSGDNELERPGPRRIETDRLVMKPLLESVEVAEIDELYRKYPETDRWFNGYIGLPNTYQSTLEYFEMIEDLENDRSDFFYLIEDKDTGVPLGQATIEDVDFHAEKCEIGVWIRKDRWNEGISKERAEGLIYSIFKAMKIQTIEVRVAKQNKISISAVDSYMREFGGSYDGCLRNTSITPNYDVVSMLVWSITRDEFLDENSTYTESPTLPSEE